MGKGIYTYYKERLIEIGGNNKCLYLKSIVRKGAYDLGRIFEGRDEKISEFVDFLWSGGKFPLTVISNKEKNSILRNLDLPDKGAKIRKDIESGIAVDEATVKKLERIRREESARAIESEITKVKELKREVEEIEKETGRYEMYVGFPFVFGCIPQGSAKTLIKAPLLLFPVKVDVIDESTVEISINQAEKIRINPALVFAYAQSKRINVDQLELEFDDMSGFKSVKDVVRYLAEAHINIDCPESSNLHRYSSFKEPDTKYELSVRYAAILARLPISNSIYNDYTLLEKKNLTNDAVSELLRFATRGRLKNKKVKKSKSKKLPTNNSYIVKMLDFAQSEVVRRVDKTGNMVIYGPPGTGKSQTIVNIITDAMCKHKRVLVVSQKKAALDVVYNRLGVLNSKAMYINDEAKEKQSFYERCLAAHQADQIESLANVAKLEAEYNELEARIATEVE